MSRRSTRSSERRALSRRTALLSGAALAVAGAIPRAWSQGRSRVIGYLSNGAGAETISRPLAERGYVEGRDFRVEVRVAGDDPQEVERQARSLVTLKPDVLVAWRKGNVDSLARLTRTIPIVCGGTADPVGVGYARTLRRPGGNITGLSYGVPEMAQVIVGLVQAVRPGLGRITAIVGDRRNDGGAGWAPVLRSVEAAARNAGLAWELSPVSGPAQFVERVAALDPRTSIAYVVSVPPSIRAADMAAAFARRRLVNSTTSTQFVRDGLLMQYSLEHADAPRRVAGVIDALLRGAPAAELPFELPDRTIFIVNRRAAREIGVELPADVLARATEIVG